MSLTDRLSQRYTTGDSTRTTRPNLPAELTLEGLTHISFGHHIT